jgi:hypothetical protein
MKMKLYRAKAGTPSKLITQEDGKDIRVQDWTLRRDVELGAPLIDPVIYNKRPGDFDPTSPAVQLALKGYGIYPSAEDPDGQSARYLIAIPYEDVWLVV